MLKLKCNMRPVLFSEKGKCGRTASFKRRQDAVVAGWMVPDPHDKRRYQGVTVACPLCYWRLKTPMVRKSEELLLPGIVAAS